MLEEGKVIGLKDNGSKAVVRFFRKSACDKCGLCGFTPVDPHIDIVVDNDLNAKAEDSVRIEVASGSVLKSALIVYLIPLITGAIGLLAAYFLRAGDIVQLTCFLSAVAIGYAPVYVIDKRLKKNKKVIFAMSCIVRNEDD